MRLLHIWPGCAGLEQNPQEHFVSDGVLCSFSFFCDLGPPVAQFAEFSKVPTVFQNFVVPWKIHNLKNSNYHQTRLDKRVEWCKGCLCKFLQHVGPTTRLKIILKFTKNP